MPIPEHVRRQAMDSVSHRETQTQIQLFQNRGASVLPDAQGQPSRSSGRPLTDDVRRQAMDAVSHRETTAQIRAFRDSGGDASPPTFTPVAPDRGPTQPLTDDVRRKAMDSVSHRETKAHIRLLENGDSITPPQTPSHKTSMIAERIAAMHKTGQNVGAIQQAITKDNFGREHEIG